MRIAGNIGLLIEPVLPGFWKKAETKANAQKRPNLQLPVEADTSKAVRQLATFRAREHANAINLRVGIDRRSLREAESHIRHVEHTWKQSDIKRAIRIQVFVAGATALPALTQGLLSVTTAMVTLSRAALVLPGVLAGVGAAAGTLVTGIGGLADALKASNDGMQKSEQFARQYARASRDLESAQRDVVKAFKDANREIRDQKDNLAQGQLSVEQARLDVQRANQRLREGGFKNMLDYKQAVLDVKAANLQFSNVLKQTTRDVQDYYENAGKTAAQTDGVKNSIDALANSLDNYRKAQFQAAGMSEQFISAMKQLAPAGQDFVLEILKMRGAWKSLQDSVQTTLFSGLGKSITELARTQLPMLKTGMQQVAAGINADFKQLFSTLGSSANSNALAKIFERTGEALRLIKPGLDSIVNGFIHLSEVGSRYLPRLALAFDKVAERFEKFIDRADKDGSLDRWINKGLDLVSSLGRSLMNVMSILGSITTAYEQATGNIGGFASTMERGLGKLAAYLKSPAGKSAMVSWIRESQQFMKTIKDTLPGIRKLFGIIGDGARQFAEKAFPIFSEIGFFLNKMGTGAKTLVTAFIALKTIKPIITGISKAMREASGAFTTYQSKLKSAQAQQKAAYLNVLDAKNLEYKFSQQIFDFKNIAKDSERQWKSARNIRADAEKNLLKARQDVAKAQQAMNAPTAGSRRASLYGLQPSGKATATKAAEDFEKAKAREKAALKDFDRAEQQWVRAKNRHVQTVRDLNFATGQSYRGLSLSVKAVKTAEEDLERADNRLKRGFGSWIGRIGTGLGSGKGGGLAGKLGGVASALGSITATLIGGAMSVGGTVGALYAMDQMTSAMDRQREAAENLNSMHQTLNQTLAKGTGSETMATIDANAQMLQNYPNPVHPDDPNQRFNAAKILEKQLGIPLDEATQLSLGTSTTRREAKLQPADQKIIAAVPGLNEWRIWGTQYKKNGIDEVIYGKALNGDPDSIGRVEAARRAIKDSTALGRAMTYGMAANLGYAPNDLGAAQEQLPRAPMDEGGGLRGLSLAAGAVRGIGTAAAVEGRKAQEDARKIRQPGLNVRGRRAFGPFKIGPGGAIVSTDGSASIEVDLNPDSVVPGWSDGAMGNGIQVEKRPGGGAVITISPETARNYFNPFASGGAVWGAGTATSDSIPAMLSNGEFVINAKSARTIGYDTLHSMNKFSGGGEAGDGGSSGGGGGFFSNLWDWLRRGAVVSPGLTAPGLNPFIPQPEWVGGSGPVAPTPPMPPRPNDIGTPDYQTPYGPQAIDTSPVTTPTAPAAPAQGIGGIIAGTSVYIPKWGGSGALPDIPSLNGRIGTDASIAPKALINPNANILDYLVQVANAYGIRAGSGPPNTPEGVRIAGQLGIPDHGNPDMGQHDVLRALDFGSYEQATNGQLTKFVKQWMADPQKVAATRQLIYMDPITGEKFGIHRGRALFGAELDQVYGQDFGGHTDHAHIAMEGVPLNAFTATGAGRGIGNNIFGPIKSQGGGGKGKDIFAPGAGSPPASGPTAIAPPPSGPAADIPGPPPPGPLAGLQIDPIDILRKIGVAIIKAIFGFFGIDVSGIIDAIPGLGYPIGKKPDDDVSLVPQPDMDLVDSLEAQASEAERQGQSDLANQIRQGKDNYLKQFATDNIGRSADSAADYFDKIGQPDIAKKIRENKSQIGKAPLPPPSAKPDQPPPPGDMWKWWAKVNEQPQGLSAPPANYSGGSPETHNAVYRAFKEAGFPDSEWPPLVELLNHENDTWDPTRPTGGPNSDARGIFQFLSTTWGAVGMQASDDPYIQGVAGMKYIKQNYGTPSAAWAFWQNPTRPPFNQNWYSLGGLVAMMAGGGIARSPQLPGKPVDPIDFTRTYQRDNYGGIVPIVTPSGKVVFVSPMRNAKGGLIRGFNGGGLSSFGDPMEDPWDWIDQNYGDGILQAAPGSLPYLVDPIANANGGLVHFDDGGRVFQPFNQQATVKEFFDSYGPLRPFMTNSGMLHLSKPVTNAAGGHVRGPGTATSDSIPALLSDGEFVMRTAAVKHWGVDRLAAMNEAPQAFANGGFATASGGTWMDIPDDPNKRLPDGTIPNLVGVIQIPKQLSGDGAWVGAEPNPFAQDYLKHLANGGRVRKYAPGGPVTPWIFGSGGDGAPKPMPSVMTGSFGGSGTGSMSTSGVAVDGTPMGTQDESWKQKLSTNISNWTSGSYWLEKAGIDTSTSGWNKGFGYVPGLSEVNRSISMLTGNGDSNGLFSARDLTNFFQMPDLYKSGQVLGSNAGLADKAIAGLSIASVVPWGRPLKAIKGPKDYLSRPTLRLSHEDAASWINANWPTKADNPYTAEELKAIDRYVAAPDVNDALSVYAEDPSAGLPRDYLEKDVALLDSAIAKSPQMPVDFLITRMLRATDFGGQTPVIGQNYTHPGYFSTTVGTRPFEEWANGPFANRPYKLTGLVPRGTPGIWLGGDLIGGIPSEKEMLFGRGMNYPVDSFWQADNPGQLVADKTLTSVKSTLNPTRPEPLRSRSIIDLGSALRGSGVGSSKSGKKTADEVLQDKYKQYIETLNPAAASKMSNNDYADVQWLEPANDMNWVDPAHPEWALNTVHGTDVWAQELIDKTFNIRMHGLGHLGSHKTAPIDFGNLSYTQSQSLGGDTINAATNAYLYQKSLIDVLKMGNSGELDFPFLPDISHYFPGKDLKSPIQAQFDKAKAFDNKLQLIKDPTSTGFLEVLDAGWGYKPTEKLSHAGQLPIAQHLFNLRGEFAKRMIESLNSGKDFLGHAPVFWYNLTKKHLDKHGTLFGMGKEYWNASLDEGRIPNLAEQNLLQFLSHNSSGGESIVSKGISSLNAKQFEYLALKFPQALKQGYAPIPMLLNGPQMELAMDWWAGNLIENGYQMGYKNADLLLQKMGADPNYLGKAITTLPHLGTPEQVFGNFGVSPNQIPLLSEPTFFGVPFSEMEQKMTTSGGQDAWKGFVEIWNEDHPDNPWSGNPPKKASGGFISGPGTPTSDSIPALLSNGEYVMNARAVKHWGVDRLNAMNGIRGYSTGGSPIIPFLAPPPVDIPPIPAPPPMPPGPAPTGSADPQAFSPLPNAIPPSPTGSADPQAFQDLSSIESVSYEAASKLLSDGVGAVLSPKGGGGGTSATARGSTPKDPRATLAPAPASDQHNNPALAGAIQGGINTLGSLASTAVSAAITAAAAGGSFGAATPLAPAASAAATTLISAGTQMLGQFATGATNVLSSLLVGTVTPSQTGQGYGAPLLPERRAPAVSNFQSIHNGNIVTNNLTEYQRLKDRKDAQKAVPFFNRVGQ